MPNVDVMVGVYESEFNRLLAGYHSNPSANNNPFEGFSERELPGGMKVAISWGVEHAPVIAFDKPLAAVWAAAQGRDSKTNEEAGIALPDAPMLQLRLPLLNLTLTLDSADPVSSGVKDVIAHAVWDFANNTVGVKLLALSVDKSGFEAIDKFIFDSFVIPQVFKFADQIFSIIHLPGMELLGVEINPFQIVLVGHCLVGAATLVSNPLPVDMAGMSLPIESVFLLLSPTLITTLLNSSIESAGELSHEGSGEVGVLADWRYRVTAQPSIALSTVDPLVFSGMADMQLEAEITLSVEVLKNLNPTQCAMWAWG